MQPGNKIGDCVICWTWGRATLHHSKPRTAQHGRSGPCWLVCSRCHNFLHTKFSNYQLREMTVEQAREELALHRFGDRQRAVHSKQPCWDGKEAQISVANI